jgi:Helicase conserved C-terminal domain/SNF2-related domain
MSARRPGLTLRESPQGGSGPMRSAPALAPHQRVAVNRILEALAARPGIILADDVGLGKSFVAAAVASAMIERGADVEFVVPAALVAQWRRTMAMFGVEAGLITHDALAGDPLVPRPGASRLMIVDEAHRFRNRATQRYRALALRTVGARCLLLTATPICNQLDDLYTLIALIAPDDHLIGDGVHSLESVFRERDCDAVASVTRSLVIRRGRDVLPGHLQFGALDRQVVRYAVPAAAGEARTIIEDLRFPLMSKADGGSSPGDTPSHRRALLRRWLWHRLESSEAALVDSIDRQRRFYERALSSASGGRRLTKADYRRLFAADEQGACQEVLFWDVLVPAAEMIAAGDLSDVRNELECLARLCRIVREAPQQKRDALLAVCSSVREPMLVFTTAIPTARHLYASLRSIRRTALLTSHEARDAFARRTSPAALFAGLERGAIDVLVATDVASEGLDLQSAGVVVHYDLPWNPVRLDQRNGRVHRIGQQRERVSAIYFVPNRESDAAGILPIIAAKSRVVRRFVVSQDGRDSVPPRPGLDGEQRTAALRPAVPADSPMARLAVCLERRRLLTPEATALLGRRWRAGAELLVASAASEYLDAARRDELMSLLRDELPPA